MLHCFVMRHKRAETSFAELFVVRDYVTNDVFSSKSETSIMAQEWNCRERRQAMVTKCFVSDVIDISP